MTYQYVRRRPHIVTPGNPFKQKWVDHGGIFSVDLENMLYYECGANKRLFTMVKYYPGTGYADVQELKTDYSIQHDCTDHIYGSIEWSQFQTATGEQMTREHFKRIAEIYNL